MLATQEAVDTYRKLAKARPDAYLPDLARALNNLGSDLSSLGRPEDAMLATQEAVDTYRKLAKARPDAYLPDLARSLGLRGSLERSAGSLPRAISSLSESLRTIGQLAEGTPQRYGQLASAVARDLVETCHSSGLSPPEDLLEVVDSLLDDE